MHLQCILIVMFGAMRHWDVMTAKHEHSHNHVIKQVDGRMCDRFYAQKKRCSGNLYEMIDLICRLVRDDNSSVPLFQKEGTQDSKVIKCKPGPVTEKNITCLNESKTYPISRHSRGCRHMQFKQRPLKQYKRLVILPFSGISHQGRQLSLKTRSVMIYPYLRLSYTVSVAYILTTNKLLVSTVKPRELFLASLDKDDKTVITKGKLIYGISVDDNKQLVFLASSANGINVMTTEGRNLKSVIKFPKRTATNIASDPKRQILYVACMFKYIASYTYRGDLLRFVIKGHIWTSFCLDYERNVLYYMKDKKTMKLYKVFLSNRTSFAVPSTSRPTGVLLYVFSNKLYLIPFNNRTTLAVLSNEGKHISTLSTGYDNTVYRLRVCAIP